MTILSNLRAEALPFWFKQLDVAGLWARRPSLLFGSCAVTLIASVMLGGGTRSGFLSDTILEFIAIPTLLLALSQWLGRPLAPNQRGAEWALVLCVAVALVPLIQLVPLPPWLWTRLPHRDQIASIYSLTHQELPWLPISVAPSLTWAAVMGLLPPFAIFLSVIQLAYRERRALSLVLLGLGIASAFLGLLQVAQGPTSPWRFFAVTNIDDAVGFFANRNHLATLLNVALLFGAAWAINVGYGFGSWRERRSIETSSVIVLTASFLGLVILIAAEASSRSRAGLGLLIVALFAALFLAVSDRRRVGTSAPIKLILGSVLIAGVLVIQFALYRVLNRFDDPLADVRIEFAQNTIHAAEAYMPFGSGFGSFVAVYPNFEPPQDALDDRYVNHAHDDVLEVSLEGGAMSLVLLAGFGVWLLWMAAKIWRQPPNDCRPIDVLLARAASVAIPIILAHSVVDYPLRTDAMMAVFALSCAFLVAPLQFATGEVRSKTVTLREQRWRAAQLNGLAVAEDRLALTNESRSPVREISEEEKRRLARLRGDATVGGPAVQSNADDAFGDEADTAMIDQPELTPADTDDDSFGAVLSEAVDLDDLARAARPINRASAVSETVSAKGVAAATMRPQPDSSQVANRAIVPQSGLRAPISTGANKGNGGDVAHTLAQLNQLSSDLVDRIEDAVPESASDGGLGGAAEAPSLVEAAQRRMKILNLMKPDPGATAKEGHQEAMKVHPRALVRELVHNRPLDPAERRLKALQLVESFRKTTGLSESPDAQHPTGTVGEPSDDSLNLPNCGIEPGTARNIEHQLDAAQSASEAGSESANVAIGSDGAVSSNEVQPISISPVSEADVAAVSQATVFVAGQEVEELISEEEVRLPPDQSENVVDTAMAMDTPAATVAESSPQDSVGTTQASDEDVGGAPQEQREYDEPAVETPNQLDSIVKISAGSMPQRTHLVSEDLAGPQGSRLPAKRESGARETAKPYGKGQSLNPEGRTRATEAAPMRPVGEAPAVPEQARWGEEIEWPEAWRK